MAYDSHIARCVVPRDEQYRYICLCCAPYNCDRRHLHVGILRIYYFARMALPAMKLDRYRNCFVISKSICIDGYILIGLHSQLLYRAR
jgi:hypothetical protein